MGGDKDRDRYVSEFRLGATTAENFTNVYLLLFGAEREQYAAQALIHECAIHVLGHDISKSLVVVLIDEFEPAPFAVNQPAIFEVQAELLPEHRIHSICPTLERW
eukprot:CAMPEP_0113870468 /NCGR_PEP_ID=MMETSP0780_2-20120614/2099_1 /TAXON_ID=652834 /ORGANISM="Palpitomonas bilix" /LENGTH=104 /DNA_ID=CAMNT_0000855741 /DNA_START=694 /DNA_END=1005 /DNA_ORIENTATION=- /assembly_acc=CAM_ASM_000599